MTKEQLIEYINHGREIEFRYNGKMYSITYGLIDGKRVISFCEFNQETTEVEKPEDIVTVKRNGISVLDMLASIGEEDIWIY